MLMLYIWLVGTVLSLLTIAALLRLLYPAEEAAGDQRGRTG